MKALKTYLTADFMNSPRLSGRVHSVFRRALNVVFGDVMITVHSDLSAGIPDSVVLKNSDFEFLAGERADTPAVLDGGRILFTDFEISFAAAPNFDNFFPRTATAAGAEFVSEKTAALAFDYVMPEVVACRLRPLFTAIVGGGAARVGELLKNTVGFGCGLTPSSDDALLGACAAAEFYGKCSRTFLPNLAGLIYEISLSRTTDVSRKYMRCAAQGRYPANLIALAVSVLSADVKAPDFDAFERLLSVGHSSGKDILFGFFSCAAPMSQKI